jgi:hypothetical protein
MPSATGRLSKLTKHLQLAFLKASAQLVEFQQFAFLKGRVKGGMFHVPFVEPLQAPCSQFKVGCKKMLQPQL